MSNLGFQQIVDLATKTIYWYGGGGTTETTTVGSTMKPHVNFDLRHTSGTPPIRSAVKNTHSTEPVFSYP